MKAAAENHYKCLSKPFLHLSALLGLVLMLMLNLAEGYRAFIYLNLLIVLGSVWPLRHEAALRNSVLAVLSFPLLFSLLHMLGVGQLEVIKEMRHLWLAGFVCLSMLLWLKKYLHTMKPMLPKAVLGVLVLYCLAEIIALYLFKRPYGTTKNPHYLALYSALGIPVTLYMLALMPRRMRIILMAVLLSLAVFVLHTWSRPIWIALIITGLIVLMFLDHKKRLLAGALMLVIPLMLFLTNLAGFGDRVTDLALNIKTEERVVIWQDAWRMQQASNSTQWLAGHGLDSYEEDFKTYSRYQSTVSFNSPHNSFMEITYTSGLLGLALCIWLYWWIYRRLWRMAQGGRAEKKLALLLISITTVNLFFIMITIPFVSHYNMYTLALVIGLILHWKVSTGKPNEA